VQTFEAFQSGLLGGILGAIIGFREGFRIALPDDDENVPDNVIDITYRLNLREGA
jgi:hypothetical protein